MTGWRLFMSDLHPETIIWLHLSTCMHLFLVETFVDTCHGTAVVSSALVLPQEEQIHSSGASRASWLHEHWKFCLTQTFVYSCGTTEYFSRAWYFSDSRSCLTMWDAMYPEAPVTKTRGFSSRVSMTSWTALQNHCVAEIGHVLECSLLSVNSRLDKMHYICVNMSMEQSRHIVYVPVLPACFTSCVARGRDDDFTLHSSHSLPGVPARTIGEGTLPTERSSTAGDVAHFQMGLELCAFGRGSVCKRAKQNPCCRPKASLGVCVWGGGTKT